MEHLTFLSSTSTSLILSMSSELPLTTFDIAVSPSSDSWTSELAWRSAVFSSRSWRCLVDDVGGRVIQSTRPIRRNAMKRTADGILVVRRPQSRITMMDSITETVDTAIVTVTNTPLHTNTHTPNAGLYDRHKRLEKWWLIGHSQIPLAIFRQSDYVQVLGQSPDHVVGSCRTS